MGDNLGRKYKKYWLPGGRYSYVSIPIAAVPAMSTQDFDNGMAKRYKPFQQWFVATRQRDESSVVLWMQNWEI